MRAGGMRILREEGLFISQVNESAGERRQMNGAADEGDGRWMRRQVKETGARKFGGVHGNTGIIKAEKGLF